MKIIVCLLGLALSTLGPVMASGETPAAPYSRQTVVAAQDPGWVVETTLMRDVICVQPIVLDEPKVSSEINPHLDLESEVASSCSVPEDGTITTVIWWAGYLDDPVGISPVETFNLRFYTDLACTPDQVTAELLNQTPLSSYEGVGPLGYPTYRYELDVDVPVTEGIFWFSAQGIIDGYPPKHGRGGDGGDKTDREPCPSLYRSADSGFPIWTPVSEVIGSPWIASHEFEYTPDSVPTSMDSWGALKSIYR
jgi:hypothetical protein